MAKVITMPGFQPISYIKFRKNPLDFLLNTASYGADFVKLYLPSYVVHSPDAVKEILTTKDASFSKGNGAKVMRKTLGNGLLTAEGAEHQKQRKLIQPAFHKKQLHTYASDVIAYTKEMVQNWDDGDIRSIDQDMMALTLRIVLKTLFNYDIEHTHTVTSAVEEIIERTAQSLLSPFPILGSKKKYKQAVQILDDLAEKLIVEAPKEEGSLLDLLISAKYEDGTSMSRDIVRDQVLTMVIAGHETTANALSWVWFALSQNQDVEGKFHAELDTVLQKQQLSFDSVKSLPYTKQIFQETLRLYPPAWMILREAKEDVDISGHTFKKGAAFLISPYVLHRSPLFFKEAEMFWPDRFNKQEGMAEVPTYSYVPFGAGSRGCIGSQFALMEAVLIMAVVGQRASLQLYGSREHITPEPLVSLRVKGNLKMKISKRK
ncbi:cytochrome P450 [Bacillus sp. HMF5848]|uniref:cytochrome P450 n=1 Tax=Bacillus sp. HMF5848 TaxID=2495421 RepID=UPI00163AD83D|nr:cytochrome P450 [Bacillus sp. HMF5848]